MTSPDIDVLVVGAGPVGLSLAMELASRDVAVVVCEQRDEGVAPPVKSNHVAARTMEIFRRLGVADAVRAAGLPTDHPHDIAFRSTVVGEDFGRIRIPSAERRFVDTDGPDGGWPTPEPAHRVNQIYLEPVLAAHARQHFGIDIRHACTVVDLDPVEPGNPDSPLVVDMEVEGTRRRLTAGFVIGCDGARSTVRRRLGIELEGDPVIQRVQSTFLRAPGLFDRMASPPAWATIALNPRRSGTAYAIDGTQRWLVHNYLRPDEEDFDAVDRLWALRMILGLDTEEAAAIEMLSTEDWFGRRLIAPRFRGIDDLGHVFLCGDSAHIWVPYAGYGMNAGIADAANLAWTLAARLQGWGGHRMLDVYEAERRPITEQVSRFAMRHAEAMIASRGAIPDDLEASGPGADASRAAYGTRMEVLNVEQYCAAGLNFGYYYDRSPIIDADGDPPPYTMGSFTPSDVPGCRFPHRWLRDGVSLWDRLGPGYTIVDQAADGGMGATELASRARARGVPLEVVATPPTSAAPMPLYVLRTDQHIAWRGAGVTDADRLLDVLTLT